MSNDQSTEMMARQTVRSLRAILYARVSTDEQADKGYSLPSQLEACRKYAQVHGFTVVAEITDDISGALLLEDRPGGQQVQAMLDHHEADVVIVYQIDRLSRDIIGLLQTCRKWLRAGIEVHSRDIGKVKSELDIIVVIKGWQASDEREKIREQTTRGRDGKAKSGKVVGMGKPLYGYRYTDGQFIIDENEATIVRLIFEWFTVGDGDGEPMSLHAIARKLSESSVPTPGETRDCPRVRASGMWRLHMVYRIIGNEAYAGTWRYKKAIGSKGHGGKRPVEEQIEVPVAAIISHSVWEAAQAQREQKDVAAQLQARIPFARHGQVWLWIFNGG